MPLAPTSQPILPSAPAETDEAESLAYLGAIDPYRERLRAAVDSYRAATSQPGNSAVVHAVAARKLRTQIEAGYTAIAAIKPPRSLAQAHESYLSGLKEEMSALDDMLEFYGSFSIQLANRAIIRLDAASGRMDFARVAFSQRLDRAHTNYWHPQTVR